MKNLILFFALLTVSLTSRAQLHLMYTGPKPYTITWQDINLETQTSLIDSVRLYYYQILGAPVYYHQGDTVELHKEYTGDTTTTSGTASFYVTTDGTSGGDPIFTNVNFYSAVINDSTSTYNYAYTLSGDKRTLTVTARKVIISGGVLAIQNVPNGTEVKLYVKGN